MNTTRGIQTAGARGPLSFVQLARTGLHPSAPRISRRSEAPTAIPIEERNAVYREPARTERAPMGSP
jgi:hypothetical protein